MSTEKSNLKFYVFGDVTPPKRNDGYDACFDLQVPNFNEEFAKKLLDKNPGQPIRWGIVGPGAAEGENPNSGFYIQLSPHQDILIPTFVKARFDPEWQMIVHNKSGVATLQKLDVGADVIDSSYEGEIHIHVFNTSPIPQFISFGQKLAQVSLERIDPNPAETWYDETIEAFKEYKNLTTSEKFFDGHATLRKDKGFSEGTGNTI
jgi:dUTPase